MDELHWKNTQLSLERPYKNDNGDHIPVLFDITPDGQHVYESKENTAKSLGDNLRRIFLERGVDFFERSTSRLSGDGQSATPESNQVEDTTSKDLNALEDEDKSTTRFMTTEELFKMRIEIIPQLFIALGEMSHARDLLTALLSSPLGPNTSSSSPTLAATVVTKPPPIVSVHAFNSQLAIGGKDEALRKAADVFKSAAESMERGRIRGERYWVDALKIRRGNWGLIPAPLPYGSMMGKGADKTSKDFLISYGLEESPPIFRRTAVGHMATYDTESGDLVFPYRQHTRLRVSITVMNDTNGTTLSHNTIQATDNSLDGALRAAQQEVVEQEIFSLLVKEAGNLPTASARVSERLIVIDAAQGLELKFELVDHEFTRPESSNQHSKEICDIIYFGLHALLLRRHGYLKSQRLGAPGIFRPPGVRDASRAPLLLQPVIDLLQYQVFCERINCEIDRMVQALHAAGISSSLRFDPVGEIGRELIQIFDEDRRRVIGGEAILRIDNRHTIRFTFLSPSTLTAHLSQATLTISSIPQLCQLLADEVERCLLQRICELGSELCSPFDGTWFVDLNRCVGRWEGCVMNFRIFYGKDFLIDCSAFHLGRATSKKGKMESYSSRSMMSLSLLSWVEQSVVVASSL